MPQRRLSHRLGFIISCPCSWASVWGRVSCCLVQCIVGVCGEGFSRLTPHCCSVHSSSQVSRIYSRCALMLTKWVCLVHILQILGLWSHLLFLFRHSSQTNGLVLSFHYQLSLMKPVQCLTKHAVLKMNTAQNNNTAMSPWERSITEMSDGTLTGLTETGEHCRDVIAWIN